MRKHQRYAFGLLLHHVQEKEVLRGRCGLGIVFTEKVVEEGLWAKETETDRQTDREDDHPDGGRD